MGHRDTTHHRTQEQHMIQPVPRLAGALLTIALSSALAGCGVPSTPPTTVQPTTAPTAAEQPAAASPAGLPAAGPSAVAATIETDQVPHEGDAADDPAVWVHPNNPALSTV